MIQNNYIYLENIDETVEELKQNSKDITCCVWNIRKKLIRNNNDLALEYSADEFEEAISEVIWNLSSLRDNINKIKDEINNADR